MRTITNPELMFPSDPVTIWVELGKMRPRTKAPFTQHPPAHPEHTVQPEASAKARCLPALKPAQ